MKKLSKLLSLLLALAMMLSLAACGGSSDTSTGDQSTDEPQTEDSSTVEDAGEGEEEDAAPEESGEEAPAETAAAGDYKIAMITDSGDITDQSFNQTTYEACKAFAAAHSVDFQYYKPDGDSTDARVAMVDAAVADGYNILVLPGYLFAGALVERSAMYPDVKFVVLDMSASDILAEGVGADYDYNPDNWDVTQYYNTDNTYCAIYQEELPGYMAGYAAVKLGYTHLGFLGGMAVPAVIRYGYGYLQGINDAANELGIADQITVEYVYGGLFYGSTEITAVMDTWYTNGTEIVFACGGGVYTSACEAAAKVGGKIIGVDTDQAALIDSAYGDGMTVTSAMKGLAATVETLLEAIIIDGTWDQYVGKIESLGLVSADDPELNYVQIPLETTQWNDDFTQEDYLALVAALYNGEIVVDNSSDADVLPVVDVAVNYQGTVLS